MRVTFMRAFRLGIVLVWVALVGQLIFQGVRLPGSGTLSGAEVVTGGEPIDAEETWMGVYMQDQKIGYTHYRFEPRPPGFRFVQDSLLRMKVLDATQVIRVEVRGDTGADYALKNFSARIESGVGEFAAHGAVEGDELRLTLDSAGSQTEQRIPLNDPIYLPVGVRQVLGRKGLHAGLELRTQVFDPSIMQYQGMQSTVERREVVELHGAERTAWRIRESFRSMTSTVWMDDAGVVLREEGPLGLVALRETRDQALTEGWRHGAPFDLMSAVAIPVTRKIPHPRDLARLELHIGGIPDVPLLVDDRQRVDGDRLVITRESPESVQTFALPYRGEQWRGELAATPFLQIEDTRVRDAARQAAAGATDARAAAVAIRRWVFGKLEKAPTASIPNAVQVLDMGVGDCNEHAVLYAALGRAVGLPTRVVAGTVYIGGVFLYHAWNEVWLGSKWVSVDATFDQMPADATHVKLLVGGPEVHDAILRMIGRLTIDVVRAG